MAKESVSELLRETGHTLEVGDFDQIARLNELAYMVTNPVDDDELSLLDTVVDVGRVRLHRLTLGAILWLQERSAEWYKDTSIYSDLSAAYAYIHAREPEVLEALATKKECTKALRRLLWTCGCTYAELIQALLRIIPQEIDAGNSEEVDANYGPLIGFLCREHGGKPTDWLWNESIIRIRALCTEQTRRAENDWEESRRQALRASTGGGRSILPPTPRYRLESIAKYRGETNKARKSWSTKS